MDPLASAAETPVLFPPELQTFRPAVQSYVTAKIKQFAAAFCRRVALNVTPAQLDTIVAETLSGLAAQEINTSRALRLVVRHDCQSTGCGETGCLLCQFNPSRLCKRNLKAKYLIDDNLKAKCNAPLRVELVDENGACCIEGLPHGMQLEIHVLNGEKYREICPDNTLLSHAQLKSCVISHHTKALLRRDGGSDDQLRCFLGLERGQASLSELQVTTSSEALLAGKAPTFRLLVWAVDASGEPVPSVTYVVSESFVVATKRVKHAIKSDIPSVADHVSKLVHIGKATVDKLLNLRQAAADEGFEISVPDELNCVDKVGQFQQLVELSEMNTDLKNKVRHLLKLSPEKWDEVAAHAQGAVMPDFRPRVWWCPAVKAGLLFSCKNGAVMMDQPIALVKMGAKGVGGEDDQVIPITQLDPQLFNTIPKLKAQAMQSWYAAQHPGWAIYWKEGQQDPTILAAVQREQVAAGQQPNLAGAAPPGAYMTSATGNIMPRLSGNGQGQGMAPPTSAFQLSANPTPVRLPTPPPVGMQGPKHQSPFASTLQPNPFAVAAAPAANGGAGGQPKASPFAVPNLMDGLANHFPQFPQQGGITGGDVGAGPGNGVAQESSLTAML
eukprot:CAMPEP_0202870554 /NCGR_PEP_ID=MMETSP1391-20130828/16057_1 /ASSEMBLY_ACC=CAM_ASM_000867 /TAXON_ID=1034604 /ORGANISM="Chlamydomonas leiostraca, Strain SAG 11-49" /LENGTH=611 /DNA_ID=CAMNT_0049551153 /DNA_START=278 /DNA_END=2109 /DNA_ORIENTATION=+